MLRCTLAGMICMMMSKKYSNFTEKLYKVRREEFYNIIKNKSYYLLRDLPVEIASQILIPNVTMILSKQKNDGLWNKNKSTKVTYDILSAFKHINILDDLIADDKLKDTLKLIADKYDYDALLIKSLIYGCTSGNDISAINKLIQEIRNKQRENGSWDDTVIGTVHYIEKLINLGVPLDDCTVKKGVAFLFDNLNEKWEGLQNQGQAYSLQTNHVFSTQNRFLEFKSAEKYKEEDVPRSRCYNYLGVMQNTACLKLLLQMGLEDDERVKSALDSIFTIFKNYKGLCYFEIQKKIARANPDFD